MEEMYKQALLDAKAVRASAMANAKASLQEAFEPKIQEMIRLKLSEKIEEELDEEKELDEYAEMQPKDEEDAKRMGEGDSEIDEATLEEILAELDQLSEEDSEEESGSPDYEAGKQQPAIEEADEEEEEEESNDDEEVEDETESEEGAEEEPTDDTKVIDITLGDLKQVLQSVMPSMDAAEPSSDEMPADEEGGSEDDIDLDEILAELEEGRSGGSSKVLVNEKGKKMEETRNGGTSKAIVNEKGKKEEKMEETKKNLEEANKTIHALRKQINEINLLNAKLLYMNKIFKSKNLSESQKVSVVTALDRASNTKEAKNIYETLKENIQPKKSQLVESKGFASKPAGVAPKKPILEADASVARWQKIAGIK